MKWNPFNKFFTRLGAEVDNLKARLEHNSKIIEEDHSDLAELKSQIVSLKEFQQIALERLKIMENKQDELRDKLRGLSIDDE